jgi:hypothetical protein
MSTGPDSGDGLSAAERDRLAAIRGAGGLADLLDLVEVASEHDAYLAVKPEWRSLRAREIAAARAPEPDGLPGDRVVVDGHAFHVHGITHADTDAERAAVREHVSRALDAGATVYCEQGIRPMYLADVSDACAMDDYRWAMAKCEQLGVDSHLPAGSDAFEGPLEGVATLASTFREAAFSLIDSGSDLYGEEYGRALGDVASEFLTSHEDLATGREFRSFALSRRAADDPGRLRDLQNYYRAAFLPQPVEREWLRRHDRELELVTHARNARMADYAVAHNEDADAVHLVVGAAHHPGVLYYLREHRDGRRSVDGFDVVA